SAENEKITTLVSFAARQRMLCQTVLKNSVLILSLPGNDKSREMVRNNLRNDLIEFNNNNKFLRNEARQPYFVNTANSFETINILTKAQTHVKSMLAVGQEVANADSLLLAINHPLYMRELIYNEKKLTPLMEGLNRTLATITDQKTKESSAINTSKLVSLVVALALLAILVLEPLFRTNEKNFRELQMARNKLLKE